ncbi:hypothetical protein X963_6193 [Burkholderia pseudomallei MSHR7498]|nr:hypothetical protein X942_6708 [Burkholderia pseudomallei MSHR5596]KGS96483.1 hypothetical protein X963_6193 [Burkholderia pseudomallei MSHR7498]KGX72135.1 hypothetical protein Y026_6266 [Burkholderia pseudomallei TSV28]
MRVEERKQLFDDAGAIVRIRILLPQQQRYAQARLLPNSIKCGPGATETAVLRRLPNEHGNRPVLDGMTGRQLEGQAGCDAQIGHTAILVIRIVGGVLRHVGRVIVRLCVDGPPDLVIRIAAGYKPQSADFQHEFLASLSEQCRHTVIGACYRCVRIQCSRC